MTPSYFIQQHDLTISSGIAIFGILSLVFPVAFHTNSDIVNGISLFAPIIGGFAFIWFVVRRFGRGVISRIALFIVSIPLYYLAVFLTINLSMSVIS